MSRQFAYSIKKAAHLPSFGGFKNLISTANKGRRQHHTHANFHADDKPFLHLNFLYFRLLSERAQRVIKVENVYFYFISVKFYVTKILLFKF